MNTTRQQEVSLTFVDNKNQVIEIYRFEDYSVWLANYYRFDLTQRCYITDKNGSRQWLVK